MSSFSEEERALMTEAAEGLVKRRFAVPAMLFLETVSPMNMVSASMLHMLSPIWRSAMPASRIDQLAALLERRDSVPEFISIIDQTEETRRRDEKAARRARKQPPEERSPDERPRS